MILRGSCGGTWIGERICRFVSRLALKDFKLDDLYCGMGCIIDHNKVELCSYTPSILGYDLVCVTNPSANPSGMLIWACHTPHELPHTPTYQHKVLHTADPQTELTTSTAPSPPISDAKLPTASQGMLPIQFYTAASRPLYCALCGVSLPLHQPNVPELESRGNVPRRLWWLLAFPARRTADRAVKSAGSWYCGELGAEYGLALEEIAEPETSARLLTSR